jgi:hypothetical protein
MSPTIPPSVRAALARRVAAGTYKAPRAREQRAEPCRVTAIRRELVEVHAGSECFVTPPELARRMARTAHEACPHGVEPWRVLEPSAGTGSLVGAVLEVRPNAEVVAVEQHATLAALVPGCHCVDFLRTSPLGGALGTFDAVIMNPPFSKGQDAKHVLHAYGFLRRGGVLVAIMGAGAAWRDTGPYRELRALFSARAARTEQLPPETFYPNTTARTVLVTLTKEN